ncbi:MAG: Mrp/NBP35 family ATP-binding protein [Acidimicrobiales bacterium]
MLEYEVVMAARSVRTNGPGASPASTGKPVTEKEVWQALRSIVDPELGSDIVDLGMAKGVSVKPDGSVTVQIALTIAGCPLRNQIRSDIETRIGSLSGTGSIEVEIVTMDKSERAAIMAKTRKLAQDRAGPVSVPPSTRVLLISSGKGGVGKSSVTANLAIALADRGLEVGILDADIWGFSIPRLLGMAGDLRAEEKEIIPLERKVGSGTLRVISMGFLSGEDDAIMWRGLVLARAVQQFLEEVRWGNLDYLLVDMPPGTGDVQMGIARLLPRSEVIVVTTPAIAAQKVAQRAVSMAVKGHLRLAGVIENMSYFECRHGEIYEIFGSGGGERLAREAGVPLLARLPLEPGMAGAGAGAGAGTSSENTLGLTPGKLEPDVAAGTSTTGIASTEPGKQPKTSEKDAAMIQAETRTPAQAQAQAQAQAELPLAREFVALAKIIAEKVAPPVEMSGCTANLLSHIEEALGPSA